MKALFVILITSLFAAPTQARYTGGIGTAEDPYQIATAADLIALGESPGDYDKHFVLTADIDLDPNLPGRKVFDGAVIAPDVGDTSPQWGYVGTPFTGVFDGQGHTLSHLSIKSKDYAGLFGVVGSRAKVARLVLAAVDVNTTGYYVGGLVGRNLGCIITSRSTGMVKGRGVIGGLVGENAGGIVASYSTATVSGSYSLGGLVGWNSGGITASYSSGTVSGSWTIGGLAGANEGNTVACYSTGTVSGSSWVGGLVGRAHGQGGIAMCYSTGAVSRNEHSGGLIGYGLAETCAVASFWNMETSGQTSSEAGTGLTTAQMQDIQTFLDAGWDFVDEAHHGTCDYWEMSPGEYPRLRFHVGAGPVMPEGAGTPEQPYVIRDARDLGTIWFEPLAHYRLPDQVDLEGITWPTAVVPWFDGTFDGRYGGLRSLHIRGGGCLGLFGQLDSAGAISLLELVGTEVAGTGDNVGGLAGVNRGTITDCCSIAGVVTSAGVGEHVDGLHVGGLVGVNHGRITGSRSSGVVTGNEAGGLAGSNGGWITTSYSAGTVEGGDNVGGLVGSHNGRITVSHSTCTVRGSAAVGGLVGRFWEGGEVSECYSTGAVHGVTYLGGLVGRIDSGEVIQCFSTGAVCGSDYIGGLVGWNAYGDLRLWRCYSAGPVRGNAHLGGLVGEVGGTEIDIASDCLWDIEASGQAASAGGTGKTTAQMQDVDTFLSAGWDFADETANGTCDYWEIMPGEYPQFRCYAGNGPVMPEGAGTAEQPYLIRDARDLGTVWFEPEAHYRLAQSVDLAGSTWSLAVVPWFGGTFDGAGHVITNLRIRARDYVGLFGRLNRGAQVAGLGLEAVDVNGIGSCVGGLVGHNGQGSISRSYSTGIVQGGSGIGGLVGRNDGSIATSYSAGTVTGGGNIGGLVGDNRGGIVTSYSTCTVSGGGRVGGLVGSNYIARAHIVMSYSTGAVTADGDVGGLAGFNYQGTVSACFWDREASGQAQSTEGTGKTTAEMQTAATFLALGWDFVGETANGVEDIWWIDEGKDYPHLWWEAAALDDR